MKNGKDKKWFKMRLQSKTFYDMCEEAVKSSEFIQYLMDDAMKKLDAVLETM